VSQVVVTGASSLTPLADQTAELIRALLAGRDAIEPAAEPAGTGETRVRDFDAARYATVRGMRVYHRFTQLGICAAKLALDDAGLAADQLQPERLGVLAATTHAHLDTLLEYDHGLVSVGIQRTNPTLMPLALQSTPGAAIALAFGAKAFSLTLSDGGSSLAALSLAARMLADDRADVCIVAAALGPCRELMASAQHAGIAASAERYSVLDEASSGIVFGEAGAALVLERADRAHARGAVPKAVIAGGASRFASDPARMSDALERACAGALRQACIEPQGLALVGTGANGLREHDEAHARAALAVLGSAAGRVPLSAVKANLGATFDVAGLLQSIAAIESLRSGVVPPIARLRSPCSRGLRYPVEPSALAAGARHALITATSFTGACSALVVAMADER
jgi:3-oxoacyl-[acyl-carrier-protein] synthase II